MAIDKRQAKLDALRAKAASVRAEAEKALKEADALQVQIKALAAEIAKSFAAEWGLDASDLADKVYVNPENQFDTWGGRGPHPKWLQDRIKQGRKKEDFLKR